MLVWQSQLLFMIDYTKSAKFFWDWFSGRQFEYYVIESVDESQQENLINQMLIQLQAYCANLYFEISKNLYGKQELIISAGGDPSLFNVVDSLVRAAPEFEKWNIISLKPPVLENFEMNYEGIVINTENLFFAPLKMKDPSSKISLRLFLENYKMEQKEDYLEAAWNIMDSMLGERSCAEDIGYLDIEGIPNPQMIEFNINSGALFRISEVRKYVEKNRLVSSQINNVV